MKNGVKTILVFGGTGLIGTALIKRLKARNYAVVNVSLNNESPLADLNIKMNISDKHEIEDLQHIKDQFFERSSLDEDFDEVYFLASYSTSEKMNKITLSNERDTVENIIKAFNGRISYASSYAVFDESKFGKGDIKESYRNAKIETDKMLFRYIDKGVRSVRSFRIPAVYGGENNNRALYKIRGKLEKHETIILDKDFIEYVYINELIDDLVGDKVGFIAVGAHKASLINVVCALKEELESQSVIVPNTTDEEEKLIKCIL